MIRLWKWFCKKMRIRFCKETKKFYLKSKERTVSAIRPLDQFLGV